MSQPLVGDLDFAVAQQSSVAKCAAETLLRVLGGTHIYVRVPLAFANPGDAVQLGLAGAGSEDVQLAPVVVLAKSNDVRKKELLISAGAIDRAMSHVSFANVGHQARMQFFESAVGVVVSGELLRVMSIEHEEIGGEPFLYRVVCAA